VGNDGKHIIVTQNIEASEIVENQTARNKRGTLPWTPECWKSNV
jgi:hypothetical protein